MGFEIKKYCFVSNPLEQKGKADIDYKHEGVNLFLAISGTCSVKGQNIALSANSGEIICCAGPSKIYTEKDSHMVGVNLNGIIPERYAKEVGTAFIASEIFLPFLPQQLLQIVASYKELSEMYLANVGFEIINTLSTSDKKAVIASQIVMDAVELIKNKYSGAYGIEELAEDLKISKSHLVREFYKHTGTTPGKYLTNVRIDAVKQLLTQSSLSLGSIAISTGFSSDNYLCKAFKKVTGETPMAYRSRIIASQYLPNQLTLQIGPDLYL